MQCLFKFPTLTFQKNEMTDCHLVRTRSLKFLRYRNFKERSNPHAE